MVAYAVKLTVSPSKIRRSDVSRLRSAGLHDREIFDLVFSASFWSFTNRFANGLGLGQDSYH